MSSMLKGMFARAKNPADVVKNTQKDLDTLIDLPKEDMKTFLKVQEKVAENVAQMKQMFYGDGTTDAKPEVVTKLADELFRTDLLLNLLMYVKKLSFESKKDVAQIYNYVLRNVKQQSVTYISSNKKILMTLVHGYSDPEIALNCGSIIREVVRHQELNDELLNSPLFFLFFKYVELPTFDIASDAFATFKTMLTKHKTHCARFLEQNFAEVFSKYNLLLQSDNYVTKRQSLKLLGELLLNRANFNVMMTYINDPENLKIMMNLLRHPTKAIQFEAFHVFKIFVANPRKSQGVIDILVRNKYKLIQFLQKFQKEKEDEQFNDEKQILLQTLHKLPDPTTGPPASKNPTPAPPSIPPS